MIRDRTVYHVLAYIIYIHSPLLTFYGNGSCGSYDNDSPAGLTTHGFSCDGSPDGQELYDQLTSACGADWQQAAGFRGLKGNIYWLSQDIIAATLPKTNSNFAPENRSGPKRKRESTPTIHFQVRTVSFREGRSCVLSDDICRNKWYLKSHQ